MQNDGNRTLLWSFKFEDLGVVSPGYHDEIDQVVRSRFTLTPFVAEGDKVRPAEANEAVEVVRVSEFERFMSELTGGNRERFEHDSTALLDAVLDVTDQYRRGPIRVVQASSAVRSVKLLQDGGYDTDLRVDLVMVNADSSLSIGVATVDAELRAAERRLAQAVHQHEGAVAAHEAESQGAKEDLSTLWQAVLQAESEKEQALEDYRTALADREN